MRCTHRRHRLHVGSAARAGIQDLGALRRAGHGAVKQVQHFERQARALDPAFLPSLANVEATDGDAADADALARLAEKLAELEGAVRAAGK